MLIRRTIGVMAALLLAGQGLAFCSQSQLENAGGAKDAQVTVVEAKASSAPQSATVEPKQAAEASEGVPVVPDRLFTIPIGAKGIPFTNSMAMTWFVSLLIILIVRLSVGSPKIIPGRAQAIVENALEALRDMMEMIVGPKMIGKTFPLLVCLFTFILIQNWCGLLPFVGSVGIREGGHLTPFLRASNADINMVFGLTLVHFLAWFYFVMRYAGPKVLFLDLFGNKAPKSDVPYAMYLIMFGLFAFVGVIEVVSLIFRNVSLPLRLFGNIFGGDNLMEHMTSMAGWLVPIPFYFMELLVGIVQALVFTILVAVYIGQICNHSEEEHAH